MAKSQFVEVDFSNVKDSTGINPKHKPEGEYLLKVTKAEVTKTKGDDPQPMVVFLLQSIEDRSAVYPYYCPLADASLWKIRTLFINLGLPVPKSKGKLNIGLAVGKEIGVGLEDDEYNGKLKSVITNTFPANELEAVSSESDDEDYEDDEDEDEEEAPAPKAKAKKKKPAPVVEEDEDDEEDEEEEEEAPAPKARKKRKPAPVVEEEDEEEEDDEEEEAPVVKKPSARTLKRRAEKAAAEAAAKAAAEEDDDEDEDEDDEPVAPVKKARKKSKPAPVEEDEDDDLDLDDI